MEGVVHVPVGGVGSVLGTKCTCCGSPVRFYVLSGTTCKSCGSKLFWSPWPERIRLAGLLLMMIPPLLHGRDVVTESGEYGPLLLLGGFILIVVGGSLRKLGAYRPSGMSEAQSSSTFRDSDT